STVLKSTIKLSLNKAAKTRDNKRKIFGRDKWYICNSSNKKGKHWYLSHTNYNKTTKVRLWDPYKDSVLIQGVVDSLNTIKPPKDWKIEVSVEALGLQADEDNWSCWIICSCLFLRMLIKHDHNFTQMIVPKGFVTLMLMLFYMRT